MSNIISHTLVKTLDQTKFYNKNLINKTSVSSGEESKYSSLVQELQVTDEFWDTITEKPLEKLYDHKELMPALILNDMLLSSEGRVNANLKKWNTEYILLDFDRDISIKEFISKYKQFKFWLYTTWSHNEKQDKFRVVIKTKLKKDYFKDSKIYKDAMVELFPDVDPISFGEPVRLFILPIKEHTYFYYKNEGEVFDNKLIEKTLKKHKLISAINRSSDRSQNNFKKKRKDKNYDSTIDSIENLLVYFKNNTTKKVQAFIDMYNDGSINYPNGKRNIAFLSFVSAMKPGIEEGVITQACIDDVRDTIISVSDELAWYHASKYLNTNAKKTSNNKTNDKLSHFKKYDHKAFLKRYEAGLATSEDRLYIQWNLDMQDNEELF